MCVRVETGAELFDQKIIRLFGQNHVGFRLSMTTPFIILFFGDALPGMKKKKKKKKTEPGNRISNLPHPPVQDTGSKKDQQEETVS
jgi:hypothetical protein